MTNYYQATNEDILTAAWTAESVYAALRKDSAVPSCNAEEQQCAWARAVDDLLLQPVYLKPPLLLSELLEHAWTARGVYQKYSSQLPSFQTHTQLEEAWLRATDSLSASRAVDILPLKTMNGCVLCHSEVISLFFFRFVERLRQLKESHIPIQATPLTKAQLGVIPIKNAWGYLFFPASTVAAIIAKLEYYLATAYTTSATNGEDKSSPPSSKDVTSK